MYDYDCEFGGYESLSDEIALEGRREWDLEAAADRDPWPGDEDDFDYDPSDEEYDDSMDGDFDTGMRDAGYGTDEDYGYYGGGDDDGW